MKVSASASASDRTGSAGTILVILSSGAVALLVALMAGLLAATGSVLYVGGFVGAILGAVFLFAPNLLFAIAVSFALVVGGLAEFYLNLGQANWIASGLAAALWGAAFLALSSHRDRVPTAGRQLPGIGSLVLLYLLVLVLGSAVGQISITQLVVGVRNYLPFVGVMLAVAFVVSERVVAALPRAMVWVGLLQLPFCLHQFIVVGARRQASRDAVGGAAEAVNGTFGGNMFGFGYSGSMAVFVLIAACVALALGQADRRNKRLAWCMVAAAIACVGMAETKIVFVLTPLVLVAVFWEDIRHSPRTLFALLGGMLAVLGGLAAIYAHRFWGDGFAVFWHAFTYSFDPDFMVTPDHRGRVGTLIHWWSMNVGAGSVVHTLFGHGMASTLESSRVLGVGSAAKVFGVGLDSHAAAKLLWDAGVFGLASFVWIALRTGANAHRLLTRMPLPPDAHAMLKAARGAMLAFLAMLPYQVSVFGEPPTQTIFWLFVGYVEYWRRKYVYVVATA